MIRAEELRLCNYVMYNGMVMSVSEILSPKPRKDERYNNEYVIELFDGAGLINAALDEIEPIPLTEEWLNKFTYNFKGLGFSDLTVGYGMTSGIVHFYIGNYAKRIDYIHQLQNLYFALTQNELTVA
jgi:hypothetical protein